MAYIYQADVWCNTCGETIRAEITAAGNAPGDPEDESSYDSGEYPKYYDAESEESDSPQNCADGSCGGYHGTFLQNGLTQEGYHYLKSMLGKGESACMGKMTDGEGNQMHDLCEYADYVVGNYDRG